MGQQHRKKESAYLSEADGLAWMQPKSLKWKSIVESKKRRNPTIKKKRKDDKVKL